MKRLAQVLLPVAAVSALAACTATEEPDDAAASESSSSGTPSATATRSEYLEVNDEVDLTEPGTALQFGDPATIAWEPRIDETVIADVRVDSVERTTFAESFQGWVITNEMKGQTPLFVHVTITNAGEDRVGGEPVPLNVVDDNDIHVQPTIAQDEEFEPCPGGKLPKKFKPGAKTEMCLLYLLDPGRTFTAVAFQPIDAEHRPVADAISWTGEPTPLRAEEPDDKKGRGGQ